MISDGGAAVGQELPPSSWTPTAAQAFLYSAATRNPHRIHYDAEYARSEGQPGVLAQGPLQGAQLCSYLGRQLRGAGRVTRMEFRNRRPVLVGDPLVLRGRLEAVRAAELELRIWAENSEGERVVEGSAVVALTS